MFPKFELLTRFLEIRIDFGDYEKHAPYYIITLVFHNQLNDISENIRKLDGALMNLNYADGQAVHTEPLIRREYPYQEYTPTDYKLFQVADLICTLELLEQKMKSRELSRSEQLIFHSKRDLNKDFLKGIHKKEFK